MLSLYINSRRRQRFNFVLNWRARGRTFRQMGEYLGLSTGRVRVIFHDALRWQHAQGSHLFEPNTECSLCPAL